MPQKASASGSELFIVDNSNPDWQVRRYLRDWCQVARQFDIATGYFEIGALLCLNREWLASFSTSTKIYSCDPSH
jgi:hypothetical protein